MSPLRVGLIALAAAAVSACSVDEGLSARECTDGLDNDTDGWVDCADPGCCGTWICGVGCNDLADDDDSAP